MPLNKGVGVLLVVVILMGLGVLSGLAMVSFPDGDVSIVGDDRARRTGSIDVYLLGMLWMVLVWMRMWRRRALS